MSEISASPAPTERGNTVALVALIAGVAAVVSFLIAPAISDVLWPIGAAAAAVAVVAGIIALRQRPARRWQAIVGLVLGGIILAWFLIYLVLAAGGVVDD